MAACGIVLVHALEIKAAYRNQANKIHGTYIWLKKERLSAKFVRREREREKAGEALKVGRGWRSVGFS